MPIGVHEYMYFGIFDDGRYHSKQISTVDACTFSRQTNIKYSRGCPAGRPLLYFVSYLSIKDFLYLSGGKSSSNDFSP